MGDYGPVLSLCAGPFLSYYARFPTPFLQKDTFIVKNVTVKDISVNLALGAVFLAVVVWACTDSDDPVSAEPVVESRVQDGAPFTDPRDNRVYKTVKIGEQVWMAENMKFYDADKKGNFYGKSWCYGNVEENCETYGRLYHWNAAAKACPEGWHLPSKDEFTTLFEDVGGVEVAGKMLKAKESWPESDNNDDTYGLRIVPGGYYYMKNFFYGGENAYLWTSTEVRPNNMNSAGFVAGRESGSIDETYAEFGLSVRCVQDQSAKTEQ